jgi:hypothetical protein
MVNIFRISFKREYGLNLRRFNCEVPETPDRVEVQGHTESLSVKSQRSKIVPYKFNSSAASQRVARLDDTTISTAELDWASYFARATPLPAVEPDDIGFDASYHPV